MIVSTFKSIFIHAVHLHFIVLRHFIWQLAGPIQHGSMSLLFIAPHH